MLTPLKENPLFRTPKDHEDLHDYIERFNGVDKGVALAIMGMTWNLAVKLFNKAIENEKDSIDEDL